MAIPNQISHREAARKQKAAGRTPDNTAGRHGQRPAHTNRPPIRKNNRVVAPGGTLAEQLGLPGTPAKPAAVPLASMTPPATANVPATATPKVQVDPKHAEGDLPPVASLKPKGIDMSIDLGRAIESNRPVREVDAKEAAAKAKKTAPKTAPKSKDTKKEAGKSPLI